ncbi:carboxypeptidase C [Malassezia sp. CBS 17886]|nr:carboxypeptidase C [Malassezia sp. CBS 17886]
MYVRQRTGLAALGALCITGAHAHNAITDFVAQGVSLGLDWSGMAWQHADGFRLSEYVPGLSWLGEKLDPAYPHAGARERVQGRVHDWLHTGMEVVEGVAYQTLVHPAYPDYRLRLTERTDATRFCDPNVEQVSGYLDIHDDAHLWFILYQSRADPATDPLVLWLNGGPGCSSSTGMLFELGPCWVADEGRGTVYNEHSWNSNANLLFLDQPLQVGYSYSDSDEVVDTSDKSAEDVYAFLQLFLSRFPEYAERELTVAAESYGGEYAPHIGAEIHRKNKELAEHPRAVGGVAPSLHVNLASLMIGNGLTSPAIQFRSVPEYACSPDNKYHLFDPDSSTCKSLYTKSDACGVLIEQCSRFQSRLACVPAALYCWGSLYGPAQQSGVNLYDVRLKCDREADGDLCYREMGWMETLMNEAGVKEQLGVPPSVEFKSCNMGVNQRFMMQGDSMVDSAKLLPPLLADGVRVLVYAGEADFMCNAIGNREWVIGFDNVYHEEIANATDTPFFVHGSGGAKPKRAGYFRKAGDGAGNLAFAWIDKAGHMVPHDQPHVALSMLNSWLANDQFGA